MSDQPSLADQEPRIRNCQFKYECDMHWDDLKQTGRPNVRFCETCSKSVHFVSNRVELALAIQGGLCVCMPLDIFDRKKPSNSMPAKTIQDPRQPDRHVEVTLGVLTLTTRDMAKVRDISDIPAWLRKSGKTP